MQSVSIVTNVKVERCRFAFSSIYMFYTEASYFDILTHFKEEIMKERRMRLQEGSSLGRSLPQCCTALYPLPRISQ